MERQLLRPPSVITIEEREGAAEQAISYVSVTLNGLCLTLSPLRGPPVTTAPTPR